MNPPTCQQCGQPITGNTPGDGLCASCVWVMLHGADLHGAEHAPTVALPASGLPSIPGHNIVEELARGGMGIVYRARQLEPQREVALKMLLPFDSERSDVRERFQVEITALADLDHPGILPLYQVGETGGRPWFTMKLAAGGSLASRLKRKRKPSDPAGAAKLIASMADAVQHAHAHGVLHRDIKPGNILFDERDEAFLADFGLAKLIDSTADMTHTAAVLGTPCYMAPEVAAEGAKSATTASDIYALGAVLYELITGRPPFIVEGMAALVKKIIEDEPERPSTLADHVPRDLELVCLTCLAKDPRQRYATAADVAEDLRRWGRGEPVAARRAGTAVRLWAWARRRPALAGVSAALVATVSIATVWLAIAYVRLSRTQAEADKSRGRADDQSEFLIGRFADSLETIGRIGLIETACAKAADLDDPIDDDGFKRRARLLLRWAAASWAKGDAAAAAPRLREVINSMGDLHRRTPADATAFTLAIEARCRLAAVLADTVSFDEAFGELDAAAALVEKPGTLTLNETLRMQYEIDRTRARIFNWLEEKERALKSAKTAADSCRTWQGRKPDDPERSLALAGALREYGKEIFVNGSSRETPEVKGPRLEKALATFTEARALMQPLATRSPADAAWEFEYAQDIGWTGAMLRRQAAMHREAGRTAEAEKTTADAKAALMEAQEILARLVARDQLNWYWQFKLSDTDWALGEFYEDIGDPERAKEHRARRRERLALISKQAPEVRGWELSKQKADLGAGTTALASGDKEIARECFKEALENGLALVTRRPASRTEQDGWRTLIYTVAEQWLLAGDGQTAVAIYEDALKTCATQAAAGDAPEWWQWSAGWLQRRLAVTLTKSDPVKAIGANLKSLEHRAALLRSRWLRALEDPAAVPNSFKESERLQLARDLHAAALKVAEEVMDHYVACRDVAGPPLAWASPLHEVVDSCIKKNGPEAGPARLLAARAAVEFFPKATRSTRPPAEQQLAAALETLAGPPPPP